MRTSAEAQSGRPPTETAPLALVADALTAGRLVAAPALAAAVASGRLAVAATLLAGAWLTDGLDGVAARASGRSTGLGRFDLLVDTAVGAGVLAGLTFAGNVPALLGAALLAVLTAAFLALRNPALSMALQATGYAWFLWLLWSKGEPTVWLPVATAACLFLVHRRRLFRTVIPAFLRGVATLTRRRERFDL